MKISGIDMTTVLIRKIKTFLSFTFKDKVLLLEALLLTGIARVIMLLIPFQKYKRYIGTHNEETPYETDINHYETIKKVAWAVSSISRYTPWESKCLVQALTAQRMLKKRRISSTLYLGVAKDGGDGLKAHAWLRCGQIFVTGGYNKNEFKEVAKFKAAI